MRRHLWKASFFLALPLLGCSGEDAKPTSDVVFDRTKVHAVEITVDAAHLSQLEMDLDNRVPCTITYDGETIEDAGIRQKGNTAVSLSGKPSFSVKLDEFVDKADLFGLNKILLNASDQDLSFMRELVGSEVHTRAGIPAARITHATVTLNGVDHGIYVVAEAVDTDFLRLHFGEGYEKGNLYEGPCCGDFVGDIAHMDLEDETKDGRSRDDITALAQIIQDTPDAELEKAVSARLDFGRFMTSFALEALLGHWDGYAYRGNNFYMYDNPQDSRFVFIPHGMDRILDKDQINFDPEGKLEAWLAKRIRAIPALDQKFHDEIARLHTSAGQKETMLAIIDEASTVLRTAKSGARTSADLASFEANAADLRSLVELRSVLLDPSIVCGDGAMAGLETCDDGNTTSGDGCSARCRVEP